jgi:hypothetical protein
MKKILSLTAVVILLLLVMAPASYAAHPAWGGDGGNHYCVQWGDTLFSIGRRYGVNPYHIAQVNGLQNPNHIYAGQCLYIPSGYGWNAPAKCQWNCGYQQPRPEPYYRSGYGYDGAGYYYYNDYPQYKRYSYPCGYHSNCYQW